MAAAAAPALAVSDSDPAGKQFSRPSSAVHADSSDPDATLVSPAPLSATMSPSPRAAAGTSMATAAFAQATSPALLPNFGPRYEVLEVLGKGGMGTVYKARDLELDRLVALKLLRPELVPDAAAIQRFKQELLLASKISHRNILRIHDLGDANGVKFISMAYIEGQDLHRLIRDQKRLPLDRALSFARQILYALDAAHAEGVVHRDLKPQNIMIGAGDHVYVMDFGLAKSAEADLHMTLTGQVVGTPQYMAPEQVEGAAIDHRADLYAFGLILDEMLTGDLVFKADSAFHLMLARIREAPRSPRELVPEIPEYIERIIMRCLMRSPDERYQSAREILDDIAAQSADSVPAQETLGLSLGRVTATHSKRRTMRMLAVLLSGAVVLGGATIAVPSLRHRAETAFGRGTTALPTTRIAVLPLKVAGDTANFGYIAEGLGEALTADLGDLNSVQVASATAIQRLPANVTPQQAANSLGADYVISGTLTTGADDSLKVVLNLSGRNGQVRTVEKTGVKRDLLAIENSLLSELIATPALKLKPATDRTRALARSSGSADAEDLYLQGRNLLVNGQLDNSKVQAALDKFEQATKSDSGFTLAYTGIADAALRLYKSTHDPSWAARAQSASQQADRLNDSLPEVHFSLGSVYTATGQNAAAIAELKRAVALAPNSDEGYQRLGDAYRTSSNEAEAVAAYRKAIELNPYFWYNYNVLGTTYIKFGENRKAIDAFEQALARDKNNYAVYRNLGVAYFQLGDFNQAVTALKQSLSIKENAIGYTNLGTALFYLKQYDEAARSFEKALTLNSGQNLENNLGSLADAYRWSNRPAQASATYDKAIAAAMKALQVNPRDALAISRMGTYYAKKGDLTRGLELARRATLMDPGNVEPIYNLALVEAIAGHNQEALTALKRAIEKGFPRLQARNDPEFGKLQSMAEFAGLMNSGK